MGFHIKVGDRVEHLREPGVLGTVTKVDKNLIKEYGITTVNILWDDAETGVVDTQ